MSNKRARKEAKRRRKIAGAPSWKVRGRLGERAVDYRWVVVEVEVVEVCNVPGCPIPHSVTPPAYGPEA